MTAADTAPAAIVGVLLLIFAALSVIISAALSRYVPGKYDDLGPGPDLRPDAWYVPVTCTRCQVITAAGNTAERRGRVVHKWRGDCLAGIGRRLP